MPRRKANPQTTPRAVYLSILKAKRSDFDIAERQRSTTKFMLIEYCLEGFKNIPLLCCVRSWDCHRESDTDEIVKKKNAVIVSREGGKQRDQAYVSHIPIWIAEKFWGGSQEELTLER